VFQLVPDESRTTWTETVLYSFCSQQHAKQCLDGSYPQANLITDAAGNLYGTTFNGGASRAYGSGVVFQLTPNDTRTAWTETVLYSFCSQDGCTDGRYPQGQLMMDSAGNLYGTAAGGRPAPGPSGYTTAEEGHGVAFQLTPNQDRTAWTETVLYLFCSQTGGNRCLDGNGPAGGLVMDGAGNLYGVTGAGGTVDLNPPVQPRGGTVFMLEQN
jgi:uncharacterized repeat protein (TIGR03803 family)